MGAPERPALGLSGYVDGIDVSWVQQGINYEKVAAAGFRFAVYKAAEGVSGVDSTALAHAAGFIGDLLFGKPALFHRFSWPRSGALGSDRTSSFELSRFSGGTSAEVARAN